MFGHGEAIRHLRYVTEEDAHGNSRRVLAGADDVANVGIGPTSSDEDYADGHQVTSGITLYLPFDMHVSPIDRFEVRGVLYEVEGIPLAYRNPFTGWSPGATVSLRRVSG